MSQDNMKYNKLEGTDDFLKIIKKALHDNSPIIAWVTIDGKRLVKNCRVSGISKPKQVLTIDIPDAGPKFKKMLYEQGLLNFFISTNYSLFKLKPVSEAGQQFIFRFPETFIRLERRKTLRLVRDKRNQPKISFEKFNAETKTHESIAVECKDYSVSGAAFNVNRREIKLFKNNELIREIEIVQDDLKFVVNGRVIYKKEIDATDAESATNPWRVGIEFLDINPKQEIQINRFILENINLNSLGKAPQPGMPV
ncbi:MAG: PilZ domain-containing protein [Halobacteriovoraceae bacterium]|nr:PilZ domain-containing protein [Halobacteriovoraceae bacterium]MCB9095226.1 PilZ domain-containing protein [Halobacteriovoraceae bacterium]